MQGLLGAGLEPASDRFGRSLAEALDSLPISGEWETFPDFLVFFENLVGTAVIKSLFGPTLLSLNPDFVRDLWAYDKVVMSLAKRLPIFCIPGAYKLRSKLLDSIKKWHTFAASNSEIDAHLGDEDFDQLWGSQMMRDRYRMLLDVEHQDCDSVASTDLALIWA